jgi:short-subunit dehydrogenase
MQPMNFRGRWVVITGASSGLGREMARQLVRKHGANIVAVARRADRLEELRRELEQQPGTKVEPVVADLARSEEVERLLAEITEKREPYGVILNAGVTHFGDWHELDWERFQTMLHTNVTSVVRLTMGLLPRLERANQGGGLMIVSSMAGLTPVPYQTAYSATKAFLINYGCGLWHELRGKNVSITTYAPAGIATEMTSKEQFQPLRGWLMDADKVADDAVEAFRLRKYLEVPGATNRIGAALMRVLPQRFVGGRLAASYKGALDVTRKGG